MELAKELIFLVLGFVYLAKGSDWLVEGGSALANRMGIRQLVIGLTVVAWGTSAPELVVSTLAAVDGKSSIAMGNVLGSNVANIGLVLGICAIILPSVLEKPLGMRDGFWFLASVGILWWVTRDLEIDRLDGLLLLGALAIYNFQLFREAQGSSASCEGVELPGEGSGWMARNPAWGTLIGGVTIAVAAWIALVGAKGLAFRAGVDDFVIGMTVMAIGTSLPELAAGVTGALKKQSDISIGNVVGSNVFNLLAVIGVVAIIHPLGGDGQPEVQLVLKRALEDQFPVVFGFTVAAVIVPTLGGARLGRLKGYLFFAAYAAFMAVIFIQGPEEASPDGGVPVSSSQPLD